MTGCSTIMAILQENRVETAPKVQDVLTEYGCNIRLRLGLHDAALGACSNTGMILLQLCGEQEQNQALEQKLRSSPYVKVKIMALDF